MVKSNSLSEEDILAANSELKIHKIYDANAK